MSIRGRLDQEGSTLMEKIYGWKGLMLLLVFLGTDFLLRWVSLANPLDPCLLCVVLPFVMLEHSKVLTRYGS